MITWPDFLPVYRATFPFRGGNGAKRRWGVRIPHEGPGVLLAYGSSKRVGIQTASKAVVEFEEARALAGLLVPTRFEFGELFLFEPGAGQLDRCGKVQFAAVKTQANWLERNISSVSGKAIAVCKMEG